MGCDIHCYIEYKQAGREGWSGFGGRINPGRHYGIFAKMADVRNDYGITPIAQPRGLPEDASYRANDDNRLYITKSEGEGFCSPESAERWVKSGASKYVNSHDGKPAWVTHPDWHSHSWLTAQELENSLSDPKVEADDAIEYRAVAAVLRFFENTGREARLVFWFDN